MSEIDHIIQNAQRQCLRNGTRLTVKRKRVLTALLQCKKALSAYEVIDHCKENFGETMPAMSVYRILGFLENEQLVHRLNVANKYVACEHISCDHHRGITQFLICRKCSKVKEIIITPATMADVQQAVSEAGFNLITPQLEMNCLCDDCISQVA